MNEDSLLREDQLPLVVAREIDSICDKFESAWKEAVGGNNRPRIDEFLGAAGEAEPIIVLHELLLLELHYRHMAGENPNCAEYQQRFPELDAEWLSDAIDAASPPAVNGNTTPAVAVASTASFDRRRGDQSPANSDEPWTECDRTHVADYELLDELGRGGMGIVYRARQLSADRIVAIKLVRTDRLKELPDRERQRWLDRFHTEAHAAARLEHDHVVPVYDVGEDDGCAYYSMRLIEGESLADALRDGPVANKKAAQYLAPICRAVHYAHSHDVLHRDLKPRNILLDQDERPYVADFGLAKLLESAPDATRTGEWLGTPSYMSPEQSVDSARVTKASDIYGLGATLYSLLTGRPPFQAATIAETLFQVKFREPAPPRQLNSAIDRDLETICLKCLQKEPTKRYSSAADVADDLQRFLDGVPIKARRISPIERGWRWCRRNPRVASLLASVASLILTVVVVLLVANIRIEAAFEAESAAKEEAFKNYQDTIGAIDSYFVVVSESSELRNRGLEELRRSLLTRASDFYTELLEQHGDDLQLQEELALASYHLAGITAEIDSLQKAVLRYQQAIDRLERLSMSAEDAKRIRGYLAQCHRQLGDAYRHTGDVKRSETALLNSKEIHEQLVRKYPDDDGFLHTYARTLGSLSLLYRRTERPAESEDCLLNACEIFETAVDRAPDNSLFQQELGVSYLNLANHYRFKKEEFRTALGYFEKALQIQRDLVAAYPDASDKRRDLATTYYNMSDYLNRNLKDTEQAEKALREAISSSEWLVNRHPNVHKYRHLLAKSFGNLGVIYAGAEQHDMAESLFRKAADQHEQLVDSYSDVTQYAFDLAVTYFFLADVLSVNERAEEKARYYAKSLEQFEQVLEIEPTDARARAFLSEVCRSSATLQLENGSFEAAISVLDRGLRWATGELQKPLRILRAMALAHMGDHASAVREVEDLSKTKDNDSLTYYELACVYALAAGGATRDLQLEEAERSRLVQSYTQSAIDLLKKAKASGFFDSAAERELLQSDSDFDSIRETAEFAEFENSIR